MNNSFSDSPTAGPDQILRQKCKKCEQVVAYKNDLEKHMAEYHRMRFSALWGTWVDVIQ